MIKNLFILDYNDTIVYGIERVSDYFLKDFFGEEIFNNIKNSSFEASNEFEIYKQDNSYQLSYIDAKKYWNNFKNGIFYYQLNDVKSSAIQKRFNEIEEFFKTEKNINYKEYCCDEILCLLIALYNIFITNVKPEENFKFFVDKYNNKENILLINTGGPQKIVENELKEFIQLNIDEYNYLKYFLDNQLIFGATSTLSKKDDSRINILINLLKERNIQIDKHTKIIIIGDAESDAKNFEEFAIKQPDIKKSIFIIEKRVNDYNDLIIRSKKYKLKKDQINISNQLKDFYENQEKLALKIIKKVEDRKDWIRNTKPIKKNYNFVENFSKIYI